jgi:hypothetical protein
MDADELLKLVTIPSPCTADWGAMPGDDRVRTCQACGKPVHDFRALTSEDAASLVASSGGDLCCRITKNPDGTVVTAGKGAIGQAAGGALRFRLRTLLAIIAGIGAALGFLRILGDQVVVQGVICPPPRSVTTGSNQATTATPSPGSTARAGDQGAPADSAIPVP